MVGSALPRVSATVILAKPALQRIFDHLCESGFQLIGPTVRDGAIVLDSIRNLSELPAGWALEQKAGSSRLLRTHATDYFAFTVGPHSWKRYLFPPQVEMLTARRNGNGWVFEPTIDDTPPFAFIGVRSCDLHAIAIQDDVFVNGSVRDPHYAHRRERAFILAVNCSTVASTCFCTSMNTGPRARSGFDLVLTELPDSFAIEIGSEAGSNVFAGIDWQPASAFDVGRVSQITQRTERQITRQVTTSDLPQLLYNRIDHPYWDKLAARCLSCANCTLVCPTCFCSTVEDSSNLSGTHTKRTRLWDSCFILDFSHVHGGNIRPTTKSRFRQWMTHKLAAWIEQFGRSGCVGCGRCIAWCPVGIDITEELSALRSLGAR
ncbi:MAG TPA: 4Fe-4S dicluster domain-containing protein [Terracidiphilus sp.]|nr:4Fe-4S dicluster domain-containing protein [Terracidiphilus sp.]